MKKHKITHKREKCIGCRACTLSAPNNWKMDPKEGKANLIDAKKHGHLYIAEIFDCDLKPNQIASKACPMNIIKID